MFAECPVYSRVTCNPCPSPQVPRGPCFPWSPLAPPLLHGLVSTATQVLLSGAHGTEAGSRVAISNHVPSAKCPQLWGGGGEGGAPAPCLWQRLFGQQCMLGSKLCPLGLHGNASAVPAHLASTNAQCCHRFAPTGHPASLSPDPGTMARAALSFPALWEHGEWTRSA